MIHSVRYTILDSRPNIRRRKISGITRIRIKPVRISFGYRFSNRLARWIKSARPSSSCIMVFIISVSCGRESSPVAVSPSIRSVSARRLSNRWFRFIRSCLLYTSASAIAFFISIVTFAIGLLQMKGYQLDE